MYYDSYIHNSNSINVDNISRDNLLFEGILIDCKKDCLLYSFKYNNKYIHMIIKDVNYGNTTILYDITDSPGLLNYRSLIGYIIHDAYLGKPYKPKNNHIRAFIGSLLITFLILLLIYIFYKFNH